MKVYVYREDDLVVRKQRNKKVLLTLINSVEYKILGQLFFEFKKKTKQNNFA